MPICDCCQKVRPGQRFWYYHWNEYTTDGGCWAIVCKECIGDYYPYGDEDEDEDEGDGY